MLLVIKLKKKLKLNKTFYLLISFNIQSTEQWIFTIFIISLRSPQSIFEFKMKLICDQFKNLNILNNGKIHSGVMTN